MLFVTFLCSAALTWLTIIATSKLSIGADEPDGVQKFHEHRVARLGGVPIFVTLVAALLLDARLGDLDVDFVGRLIVCLLPAFGIGLYEDLTRKAGISNRLVLTMVSAALGYWLLRGQLTRLDMPWLDAALLTVPGLCLFLTMVAAGGVAHSVNIIDGFNGLSSFFAIASFTALGLVAHQAGDPLIARLCFISAASVAGFMIWNFPFGRIFLGDAGAYLVGFLLAEFCILLVYRNPTVSAWSPLLIMLYPIWETLFSMARRARGGVRQVSQPDALHLHQLIYRRVMKGVIGSALPMHKVLRNSMTSVYVWVLIILCLIPGVVFATNAPVLIFFVILFVVTYLVIYRSIVRFSVPRWIVVARKSTRPLTRIEN